MTSHAPRQSAIHPLLLGILQDFIILQDIHSHIEVYTNIEFWRENSNVSFFRDSLDLLQQRLRAKVL